MSYHSQLHLRPSEAEAIDLIRRYVRVRREAHEFRLAGAIESALTAEGLASDYIDLAATDEHDASKWEDLIDACDDRANSPVKHPETVWTVLIPRTRAEKRAAAVAILNKRFPVSSQEDRITLAAKGCTDCTGWGEWIVDNADNSGLSRGRAAMLFDLLGPTEAFDGFVTGCEDADGEGE